VRTSTEKGKTCFHSCYKSDSFWQQKGVTKPTVSESEQIKACQLLKQDPSFSSKLITIIILILTIILAFKTIQDLFRLKLKKHTEQDYFCFKD